MRPRSLLLATMLVAVATTATAASDPTKRLGRFGEWESYTFGDGANRTCYTATAATKVQGADKGKATAYLTVTHRPGTKSQDVVSINSSFGFKKDSEVEVQIGALKNTLFTKGDNAWTKDAASDKVIVGALRKGKEAVMHASPAKGPAITVTFSLSGFADALTATDKTCGVKR
ncbi:conserved exported hypothetical protein [Candidatus Terasakiella magnetica]|nr:conserved exported hypothetical protein [Candidatus Terasakiella magnetica]